MGPDHGSRQKAHRRDRRGGDVAAAKAAAAEFFAAEVDRLRVELDKAARALAAAESRQVEVAEGARMTAAESVAVHAAVQAPAYVTRALIKGTTTQTRSDYQAIRDRADAVKRGLIIEGYAEVARA
ncbi:hypothetical protein ACFRDV_40590 [Streptomyces fagopyri]|uniref:hypothetical protein n=1 Tax=Streptomyces fagopyri TaxID=2662397 RepID=UPI0036BCF2CD